MSKKSYLISIISIIFIISFFYWFNSESIQRNNIYRAKTLVTKAYPNFKIIKQFDTGIHLQAFIIKNKKTNTKSVVYTNPKGDILIAGNMFSWNSADQKLTNINNLYITRVEKNKSANDIYEYIRGSKYIQQGSNKAPHKFYAIIKLNCSYCNALFKASQEAIKLNQLAVRWIIIDNSNNKSLVNNIYSSKEPLKALKEYELNKKYDNSSITKNNNTVKNNKIKKYISYLPTILYKNHEGLVRIINGDNLPLTPAKIAQKDNTKKVNQLLILLSNQF